METDIAVDLMGLTGHSRSGILAFRPAPVQVNYLGFPATMAAEHMDYILADSTVLPETERHYYREQAVYLPDTYMPSDSKRPIAAPLPSRAETGLPEAGFVFCSFNNAYKFSPEMFSVWMRILKAVEGSVLWLADPGAVSRRNLVREAEARDVSSARLVFAPQTASNADHLARLTCADLFLDTLPCNAHTTAMDALWAGVPVLTCPGSTFAGRVAASLLKAVGLSELIAPTLDAYEKQAVALAMNPSALAALKKTLAGNRVTKPLFDTARFARHLEAAYAAMHRRVQAGLPPQRFSVDGVP